MKPEARALLTLRKRMGLLLNFRPMVYYKSLAHLANVKPEMIPDKGVEQVFIRFLLEDSIRYCRLSNDISEDIRAKLGIKMKKDVVGDEEMITELAYYRRGTIEKYLRPPSFMQKQRDFRSFPSTKLTSWRATISGEKSLRVSAKKNFPMSHFLISMWIQRTLFYSRRQNFMEL